MHTHTTHACTHTHAVTLTIGLSHLDPTYFLFVCLFVCLFVIYLTYAGAYLKLYIEGVCMSLCHTVKVYTVCMRVRRVYTCTYALTICSSLFLRAVFARLFAFLVFCV